ncbi:DUF885 domain-containing protein [Daejeonella lutea]|uniref:Uncharacterized conserved protein, DUF885 familyt n=1 Tax=Daejeonella lutea TaxID=572036 RepID=A0A1T5ESV0_9SPHI|nr:DUF885 domain-containing protein [Daejeonella lutea]SKB87017.1 Uncharacterized conserved protein, DUF885 familyt [Daejeonella lutea]
MRPTILATVSLLFATIYTFGQTTISTSIPALFQKIKDFEKQEWQRDSADKHPLRLHNEEKYQREFAFYNRLNEQLLGISKNSLPVKEQINYELLQHDILDNLATYKYKSYLNPIISYEGFHTSLAGQGNRTLNNKKDTEQYMSILQDIPRYVEENLKLMRTGLSLGISQPKVIIREMQSTYQQHIVDSVEKSAFWKPLTKKPFSVSDKDWGDYQAKAREVIAKDVISSYRQIKQFFENEYLPKTRAEVGASALPEGAAYYEDRVRHYTTTSLTSEDIYNIGLAEVARIQSEMNKVMQQVGFKGTFKEFIKYLRSDPKFYPKTSDELLKEASYIAKQIDGKLPSLFGRLPRQPYTVTPMLQPAAPPGLYSRGGGNTPGTYLVNITNLSSRTLYTLEALTLHESVPGHHLQISLARELDSLPDFRKSLYINAFGEGWGLYGEYLGHEMGFYKDPYSLFGRLTYDMWRACRLVIDVGLHKKGWTKEQASSYLADRTALSLVEVNTEINRYISWPGQALAYKIGELKILEMRRKTEAALKENFDVRAFHDMILGNGSVTLSVLEKITDRFIAERLKKLKTIN